jgi:hypothetical protein
VLKIGRKSETLQFYDASFGQDPTKSNSTECVFELEEVLFSNRRDPRSDWSRSIEDEGGLGLKDSIKSVL